MSLFKSTDLAQISAVDNDDSGTGKASALALKTKQRYISEEKLLVIESTIGSLNPGHSVFFKTSGSWSNIHLVEYVLLQSGPANVYFTTWSISSDAIARFIDWQKQGTIKQLFTILDAGIRNRKPEIYQQAMAAFPALKVAHCHAKVTVIQNTDHHITIIGSANYTRNPRIEAGMIIWDKMLAEENINWILEEIYA